MSTRKYFQLIYCMAWPFFSLFHPIKAVGREHIPAGAAVICANHTSLSDPLCVCFAFQLKHHIQPLGKIELLRIPILGWLLEKGGIIGVDRERADLKAVKACLLCLKEGRKLLVFPEGTRVAEGETVTGKGGAAFFASRTGTPIVPVYVPGKKRWFRSTTVVIGAPFYPVFSGRKATSEELDGITQEIMERIHRLEEQPK